MTELARPSCRARGRRGPPVGRGHREHGRLRAGQRGRAGHSGAAVPAPARGGGDRVAGARAGRGRRQARAAEGDRRDGIRDAAGADRPGHGRSRGAGVAVPGADRPLSGRVGAVRGHLLPVPGGARTAAGLPASQQPFGGGSRACRDSDSVSRGGRSRPHRASALPPRRHPRRAVRALLWVGVEHHGFPHLGQDPGQARAAPHTGRRARAGVRRNRGHHADSPIASRD